MERPPTFDRASEQRQDLDFLEEKLGHTDSLLLPIWRGAALTQAESTGERRLLLTPVGRAASWVDEADELVFLGLLEGRACFGVSLPGAGPPEGSEAIDLRLAGHVLPAWEAQLGAYARGLLHWHAHAGYCARCGGETRPRSGGHMRACAREGCGAEHYPRTDPAVLVLVVHGERVLLGRQRGWPAGMYSALAGFVEVGESLEEAARREVLEEAGVSLRNLRYTRSQPWPFPASLMVGFTAEAESDRLAPADDELEDLRWFTRAALAAPKSTGIDGFFTPPPYALAGQLIAGFLVGTQEYG